MRARRISVGLGIGIGLGLGLGESFFFEVLGATVQTAGLAVAVGVSRGLAQPWARTGSAVADKCCNPPCEEKLKEETDYPIASKGLDDSITIIIVDGDGVGDGDGGGGDGDGDCDSNADGDGDGDGDGELSLSSSSAAASERETLETKMFWRPFPSIL